MAMDQDITSYVLSCLMIFCTLFMLIESTYRLDVTSIKINVIYLYSVIFSLYMYYLDVAIICNISFWLTGKFRHLPIVENGEVIALLDITKCLYDAISRMEKAAEQGSAIAVAVEGVERQWGNNFSG
jgi:hypothetical protein